MPAVCRRGASDGRGGLAARVRCRRGSAAVPLLGAVAAVLVAGVRGAAPTPPPARAPPLPRTPAPLPRTPAPRATVPPAAPLAVATPNATANPPKDGKPTVEQEFELQAKDAGTERKDYYAAAVEEAAANEPTDAERGLVEEWDKHMEGFVPELLLTFPLLPRSEEFFYEDVTPPVLIRGGFFASTDEQESSLDFQITDPKGDIVFQKNGEAEGLFHFLARKKGTYTFIVSNTKWLEQKMVTFAVGKGNETTLQAEHVDTMEAQVKSIDRTLKDIQTESTYLWIRQKSHMKTVESIHRRVFWFCLVELLVLMGVSGFQVYYIKGLLSDRRVL